METAKLLQSLLLPLGVFQRTCWILLRPILCVLFAVFHAACVFVCYCVMGRRKQRLPEIANPLLLLPAHEIAAKIRLRQVSSQEVVQAYIDRIREVNPLLNAIVQERFLEALAEAKIVDIKIAEGLLMKNASLEEELPLLGVPVTFKESFAIKGFHQTVGLTARQNVIAVKDAEAVRLIRKAGAILLGVTNLPEMSSAIDTSNAVYGSTNNAYDTRRSPGGSSGGEASIIAAAGSVVGVGSDFVGSIRIPAMFNGIFGHKPTQWIVSGEGTVPVLNEHMSRGFGVGPLCRYASDLRLILRVLTKSPNVKQRLKQSIEIKGLKVYYIDDVINMWSAVPHHDDIWIAQKKVLQYLREDIGVEVQRFSFPEVSDVSYAIMSHADHYHTHSFAEEITDRKGRANLFLEALKALCFCSTHSMSLLVYCICQYIAHPAFVQSFPETEQFLEKMKTKFDALLTSDNVVVLLPTYPACAWYSPLGVFQMTNFGYTVLANYLGFPASQFPVDVNASGLPIGLQVMARKGCDHVTLAFAEEMERAFGGWRPPNES